MKRLFVDLVKSILRTTGMLKPMRRMLYRLKYRAINRLDGTSVFSFEYQGLKPQFSLRDPFSLTFFSYYFKESIYEEAALRLILEKVGRGRSLQTLERT